MNLTLLALCQLDYLRIDISGKNWRKARKLGSLSFVALNFLSYFTSQPWVFRFKNSLWDLAGCFNRTLIAFLPEITAIKCFIFLSITLSQPIVFANNQNKDTWDTCKGDLNTTKWQELTPAKTEKAWKAVANELIGLVKTSERKASLFKLEFIL